MKPKQIKKFLLSEIELLSNNLTDYIRNPGRDFSRNCIFHLSSALFPGIQST